MQTQLFILIIGFSAFAALVSAVDRSFNGTFEWMNDGIMAGSCGIVYNTFTNKVALVANKWFTTIGGDACTCNLRIDYQGKSVTTTIRGVSDGGEEAAADKVEISYAAYYALNPSADVGYGAVFTFVDCQ